MAIVKSMGRSRQEDVQPQDAAGQAPAALRRPRRHRRIVTRTLLVGGAVALVTRREVRDRLLDALFGPEEEFEYESQTEPAAFGIGPRASAPAEPPPGGAGAA